MTLNYAKLLPTLDNLEEDFVVLRAVAPSPGLVAPYDAIAFYSTSIGPNKIVDWTVISQEYHVAGDSSYLHHLRIAIHD